MIKHRVEKARTTTNFSKVHRKNASTFHVSVPGSENKNYDVYGRWNKTSRLVSIECKLNCGVAGHKNCMGALITVCYHQMAALIKLIKNTKKSIAFCQSREDAVKISNLKSGKWYRVQSRQSGKTLWFVIYK